MEIQDFTEEYQSKTDEELLRLAVDLADLTPEANLALNNELSRRGIGIAELLLPFQEDEKRRKEAARRHPGPLFVIHPFGIGHVRLGKVDRVFEQATGLEQFRTTTFVTLFWFPLVPTGTSLIKTKRSITDLSPKDCERWLAHWSGWVRGRVLPLYMSKFGDWFLRHPDGSTSELSVIEGTYSRIASTPDEFTALVNSQEWQEEHLLSRVVYQLHKRKIIPAQGQCYGFLPHPRLLGRLDSSQALIMEIGAWQAVCASFLNAKPLNEC